MKQITGNWQFANGTPAAGARVFFKLSQDAVSLGTGQIAPSLFSITLDNGGNIQANTLIWANDELTPSGTTYTVSVLAQGGGLIWGAENISLTGAAPLNINNAVPVSSSVISINPVLQNPTVGQVTTLSKINNVILLDNLQYTTLGGAYGALQSSGGIVFVCPNNANGTYTETLSGNLVLSKSNSGFVFLCPATITMGTNQVTAAAGINNIFITGLIPSGKYTPSLEPVRFSYTGTGSAFSFGGASADSVGLWLQNIDIDNFSAGSASHNLDIIRTQFFKLDGLTLGGPGGNNTAIGLLLDGNGNFTGDSLITGLKVTLTQIGIRLQNNGNLNNFQTTAYSLSAASNICVDVQSGNGNNFTSQDMEGAVTGINIAAGSNNFGNRFQVYNQGNTTDAIFGANSTNNFVDFLSNAPVITDNGVNNGWRFSGSSGMQRIAETTLGVSASNITFSSIPGNYRHLKIEIQARADNAATTVSVLVQFNGDAGANYDGQNVQANNAAPVTSSFAAATQGAAGVIPGANVTRAAIAAATSMTIPNYSSTTFEKSFHSEGGFADSTVGNDINRLDAWSWRNTAAITSVKLFPSGGGNFVAGTRATLYGIN